MTSPIFALSRNNYYSQRSYADYFQLIQLSGYEYCYFDEMDIHDASKCYILSPYDPDWGGFTSNAQARLIWWDLEYRESYPELGFSEVWASDATYAKHHNLRYVPFGSHKDLKLDIGEIRGKIYDVIMLSYMTDRRFKIVHGYSDGNGEYHPGLRDLKITLAPNGWDYQRHAALCQSTAMLHVHQLDGYRTIAPQRFALAAAYSLPLITETIDDRGIFGYSDFLVSDYANLPTFVDMWTKRNESRIIEDYGRALHSKLCVENTFKSFVEAAL